MSNGDQQNDKPNYYELLDLEPGASKDDVRKAYRKQALLFHPDKMKPHMKEEASQHFQLISEAYDVLFDDEKRELYDRYGYEGVKAGGDPNPQPDLSGFFPHGGHPSQARGRPQGFDFGFDSPFFSSFGVPAGAGGFHGGFFSTSSSSPLSSTSQQPYTIESVYGGNHATLHDIFSGDPFFADHQHRHMRNLFDQHMGSMFGGGGGFPRGHGPGFPPDFMHDHGFHQQHHDAFFRSAFGDRDPFRRNEQQQQQQRPTLFSTSPFANSTQTQSQSQWSGTGSRSSPFTMFGSNGDGRGGFTTSSSSSSSSMGGGGSRTSTRTTVVNGKRTTVTEVTDAQGVTTTTVDNPDGTRETFVNGVATAIEGRAEPTVRLEQGSAGQQPIIILDDDDDTQVPINSSRDRGGRSSNPAGGGGSSGGYRLGGRDEGADSSARRASRDRNQYQRSASSAARPEVRTETVFLDDDDDDEIMYETLSEHRRPRQLRGSGGRGATAGTGTGAGRYAGMRREQSDDFEDNEPDLFHPQMGNGQ
ncbi:DnaJ sub B member 2, partial [Linnemannia elongata]